MITILKSKLFSFTNVNNKNYLILFILWPFLAFIAAIFNYNQKESKKVVYFFLIYYGLSFVIGNTENDAERYAIFFKGYAALPFSDFFKIVGGLYSSDTSVDIVEPLISFIVSRFTSQHNLLFAAYASLFGFFYLKSINLLYNRYREEPGWNTLIHLVFFIMILPITAINGFRMWTAAWIFFFGAYHVILYRDPKYILIALSASLVHFSFLTANAILIIYYFARNRNIIYLPLAIVSFILPKLISPFLQSLFGLVGGGLKARVEMYSNEAVILGRLESVENVAWFMRIGENLVLYYLIFAIIIIQIKERHFEKNQEEKNLYSFLLLYLTFVNFGKEIPSFGGRFQVIFFMFATLYIFLYYMKMPKNKVNLLTMIGLFPMLLYSAIAFRQGADSFNAWLCTPGLGITLFVPGVSLAELLF